MPFRIIKLYIIVAGLACSTLHARSVDSIGSVDSIHIGKRDSTAKVWNPAVVGVLSAVIPGAGQVYTGHYVKAVSFLALEGISGGMAIFWHGESEKRSKAADDAMKLLPFATNAGDSLTGIEVSKLMDFDALSARYTMYDALSWMIGGYLYNILDGLGSSRFFITDDKKSVATAAWLSAIPALGLGQLYNGSVAKAGMVMMTQTSLGLIAINEHRLMRESQQHLLAAESIKDTAGANLISDRTIQDWKFRQDAAFRNRNSFLWYSLFFYLYGILDAVVDAHLHDYERKIRAWPDLMPQGGGAVRLNVDYRF